jgi:hypothetical protein
MAKQAAITPSLVLLTSGPSSYTTFRPWGPKVEVTASANVFIPFESCSLASEPNFKSLLIFFIL